jgi:hypothetical protein
MFIQGEEMKRSLIGLTILAITLLASPLALADNQTISFLLNNLNRSFDANVQQEILKTLRTYNGDFQVKNTLIGQLDNTLNFQNVRIEAARSLSSLAEQEDVMLALTRAHDRSSDITFRSEILKCLYKRAGLDSRIRNVLIQNLKGNHDYRIKEASAFGLINSLDDSFTRSEILNLAQNQFLGTQTRVALIKTLYHGIQYPEVRSTIEAIARNGSHDISVRSAATRVLSVFPKGRQNRSALFDLLANSQHTELRLRAASGLKFELTEDDIRWLKLPMDPRTGLSRYPF